MGRRALVGSALAFLLAGAAGLWILERPDPAPPPPFFALRREVPDTLVVMAGPDSTVLVPGGKYGWEVVAPVRYPADAVVVEAMVKRLREIRSDRVFPLTRDKLDSYGMRHPRGRIRAAYRGGGAPDTLVIGTFTLDDAYCYVRAGSRQEVALVESRTVRSYFLKGTTELRDTRLLPFLETRVARLELLDGSGGVRVALAKLGPGAWTLEAPYPGPGDAEKITEYLATLNHMHVRRFLREEGGADALYGLDRPRAGVRVFLEGGAAFGLFLGDDLPGTDELTAKTLASPHVFAVSRKYLPALQWEGDRLRQRSMVSFGLDDVDSVIARRGDEVRGHGGWGGGGRLPRDLRDVLGNWVLLTAQGFARADPQSLRGLGLDTSRESLVWLRGDDTLAVIDRGDRRAGDRALRVAAGEQARPAEILLVPAERVDPLWEYLWRREARRP